MSRIFKSFCIAAAAVCTQTADAYFFGSKGTTQKDLDFEEEIWKAQEKAYELKEKSETKPRRFRFKKQLKKLFCMHTPDHIKAQRKVEKMEKKLRKKMTKNKLYRHEVEDRFDDAGHKLDTRPDGDQRRKYNKFERRRERIQNVRARRKAAGCRNVPSRYD